MNLSYQKRFSLLEAHNFRCIYCKEYIRFKDLEIDHIIPKYLLLKPIEHQKIIKDYGLDENFDIEDYINLLPAHDWCNRTKKRLVFDKGAALYYINIARSTAQKAREIERRILNSLSSDKWLLKIGSAIENNIISKEDLNNLMKHFDSTEKDRYEPIVVSFSINLYHNENQFEDLSSVQVYDFLEKELMNYLNSIIDGKFYYTESSYRNGEVISVRLAFAQLDFEKLEKFSLRNWEIMEVNY